jgi:proline racemase
MALKAAWMARHGDRYRGMAVLEPRGHQDLTAALFTEPPAGTGTAHAGVLFMDAHGYPSTSGHGLTAAVTIAIERGLLVVPSPGEEIALTLETPAGTIGARARLEPGRAPRRVEAVAITHVPAFVAEAGRVVPNVGRSLRTDLAFSGAWFAICDSEGTGVPLTAERLPTMRVLGREICASLDRASSPAHPLDANVSGVAGVVFTGPPTDSRAHLRGLTVNRCGSVDRSASGAGTVAVMAVLDAMGLLVADQTFVFEGFAGSVATGTVARRVQVGEYPAIVVEIDDSAWIVGEHTLVAEADDPWRDGTPRRR